MWQRMASWKFGDIYRSLGLVLSSRGGKTVLVLGLVVCLYQVWRKWRTKCLVASKFQGKVVMVTGASSGLGEGRSMTCGSLLCKICSAALARVFYAAGSKVILASRNLQKLQQLKFQLDNEPRREVRVQVLCGVVGLCVGWWDK